MSPALSLIFAAVLSGLCSWPVLALCFAPLPIDLTAAPQVVLDVPDMPSPWEGFI